MQDQLRRIKELADNSRYAGRYNRLRRAVAATERDRDYKVYNADGLSVLTTRQSNKVQDMNTHDGRINAIRRAANGGSVG